MSTATVGVTSMVAPLRRVLVRTPTAAGDFAAAGWHGRPDPAALLREHEAFAALLSDLGAEVVTAPAAPGLVDAVYAYDPVFVTGAGAVLLASAKEARVGEAEAMRPVLEAAGVPVVGALPSGAFADGGDLLWVDDETLLAGRGYRTNARGHTALSAVLREEGRRLERCDLVHHRGRDVVLHLMSVVSPVAEDLAVVFEPLAPVPLIEALEERGIRRVPVDESEWETMGANVLAVRPGVVVVLDGNPKTRRALEAAGCEVHAYEGREISRRGDGGPTCLTRPLWRA